MKLVVSGNRIPPRIDEHARQRGIEVELLSGAVDENRLRNAVAVADYYLLGGDEVLSAAVLDHAPRLRAVSFLGVGAASFVDLDAARDRKIEVLTTPGVNATAVAEFAVGQALGIRRRIFTDLISGGQEAPARDSAELTGSRAGILGLGAVGTEVARMLRAGFGCDLSYTSQQRKPYAERDLGIRYRSLDSLFAESTTVFVCCALNETTRGLIGERLLKAGVRYIACIADPQVFVLGELADALSDGKLLGVALDGDYLRAPGLPGEVGRRLDAARNVSLFVTSHIAASSIETWARMENQAIDNLLHAMEIGQQ